MPRPAGRRGRGSPTCSTGPPIASRRNTGTWSSPTCSSITSTATRSRRLLAGCARRADALAACEPRRSRFALGASHLIFFLGANAVTRRDGVLSVRAGFVGQELSEPGKPGRGPAIRSSRQRLAARRIRRRPLHPLLLRHAGRRPGSMSARFDAVIVGAGPAGSSAAILLARAGWSVALVERQRFPRRKVCGECIAASNLALLDALGVGAEVERARRRRAAPGRADARRGERRRGAAAGRRGEAPLRPGAGARAARHLARARRRRRPARRCSSRARCRRSTARPVAFVCACGRPARAAPRPRVEAGARRRRPRLVGAAALGARGAPRAAPAERPVRLQGQLSPQRDRARPAAGAVVRRRLRRHGRRRRRHRHARRLHPRRPARPRSRSESRRACRRRVRGDPAPRMRRRRRRAGRRRAAKVPGSPPGRSAPACGSGRATASFASATPPARRIRSSARASAWRFSRRSCSPPCSARRGGAWSIRDSARRGAGDAAARVRGALAAALRAAPARRRRLRPSGDAAGGLPPRPGRWCAPGRAS